VQYLFGNIGATSANAGTASATLQFGQGTHTIGGSLMDGAIGDSVAKAHVHRLARGLTTPKPI
jgi:hypothetical protein